MTGTTIVCGLLVVVGLFGILVPVLPGTVLVLLGFLVWASEQGTAESWTVFAVAAAILAIGTVVKYAVPGAGSRPRSRRARSWSAGCSPSSASS